MSSRKAEAESIISASVSRRGGACMFRPLRSLRARPIDAPFRGTNIRIAGLALPLSRLLLRPHPGPRNAPCDQLQARGAKGYVGVPCGVGSPAVDLDDTILFPSDNHGWHSELAEALLLQGRRTSHPGTVLALGAEP